MKNRRKTMQFFLHMFLGCIHYWCSSNYMLSVCHSLWDKIVNIWLNFNIIHRSYKNNEENWYDQWSFVSSITGKTISVFLDQNTFTSKNKTWATYLPASSGTVLLSWTLCDEMTVSHLLQWLKVWTFPFWNIYAHLFF